MSNITFIINKYLTEKKSDLSNDQQDMVKKKNKEDLDYGKKMKKMGALYATTVDRGNRYNKKEISVSKYIGNKFIEDGNEYEIVGFTWGKTPVLCKRLDGTEYPTNSKKAIKEWKFPLDVLKGSK